MKAIILGDQDVLLITESNPQKTLLTAQLGQGLKIQFRNEGDTFILVKAIDGWGKDVSDILKGRKVTPLYEKENKTLEQKLREDFTYYKTNAENSTGGIREFLTEVSDNIWRTVQEIEEIELNKPLGNSEDRYHK